jgi:pimeloyl-ACP methyl ester carboxylesterase
MSLVHHKIYGEPTAPPIYILHGIFGMLDNWHLVATNLSSQYKVVTLDARNHGKSFHHSDSSFNAMAEDLYELMCFLGDEKSIVMGHSMGGKTAMVFSQKYPNKLSALVIVDIAPKLYIPSHMDFFNAFKSIDFTQIQTRKEADEALTPYASVLSIRQFLLKNIEAIPQGGYQLKINIHAIENYYHEIIDVISLTKQVNVPTIFILGEKSGYLKEEDKPYIDAHYPLVEYQTISKAGHWVHADNPQEFIQVLRQFLSQTNLTTD